MLELPRTLLPALLALSLAAPAFAQSDGLPGADGIVAPWDETAEPDLSALQDIFPDGLPSVLAPNSFATNYRFPASVPPPGAKTKPATRIEYAEGPVKWDVGTNVTTRTAAVSVIPALPDPRAPQAAGAAGGTGEVKGQLRYIGKEWEFYGTRSVGVVQNDGLAPAVQDTTMFGSLYKLPEWMAGGKVGASVEFTPLDERRARVEYRQPFGPAEGFVSAEQTYPAHSDQRAPAAVRAGLNRRF